MKKIIFSILMSLFLISGSVTMLRAGNVQNVLIKTKEEVPNEILMQICEVLVKDKVANETVIMGWYRTGLLNAEKIATGVYSVIYPGGSTVILILDAEE